MKHHRGKQIETAVRGKLPGTVVRELHRLMCDGPQKILLFILPPILFLIFTTIYGNGSVVDLPVGICDADNSALSRTIVRMIDATRTMNVVANVATVADLRAGICSGRFAGALYIPDHFESEIKAGRQVQPVLVRDGSNYIASSFIAREILGIMKMAGAGAAQSRLRKSGLDARHTYALISPVGADVSNMYNPIFSYLRYLTPGIVFSQFGMLVMISAGIAFAREREHSTLPQLKHAARGRAFFAFVGKSIPYLCVIFFWTIVLMFFVYPLREIASFSESFDALPTVFVYLTASWCIGAAAGLLTGTVMFATMVGVFIGMPSFIFSGWTFPLQAVPPVCAAIAQILPFTHFMNAWFTSARMGLGAFSAPEDLTVLSIMIISGTVFASLLLSIFWKKEPRHSHGHTDCQTGALTDA